MAYDMRKWAANERRRLPRRRSAGPMMVLAIVAALALAVVATLAPGTVDRAFPSPMILLLPTIAASTTPFLRENWLTERGLAAFDEFERAALLRATTRAFLLFTLGTVAFLGWIWAASAFGWPLPRTPQAWGSWCFAAFGIALILPATVAEFTVPFPPPGEEEDGTL